MDAEYAIKYPLVSIEWKDAMTIKDNWHNLEKDITEPATSMSVGNLVADNDKFKY
jgi:hypothetical protein